MRISLFRAVMKEATPAELLCKLICPPSTKSHELLRSLFTEGLPGGADAVPELGVMVGYRDGLPADLEPRGPLERLDEVGLAQEEDAAGGVVLG